jgi:hypothetical protein
MQSAPAYTCAPLCHLRIWPKVSETRLWAGSNPHAILKHGAVPFVGQVKNWTSPGRAGVDRQAKILFLTIAALYVAHVLPLGLVLGLLK